MGFIGSNFVRHILQLEPQVKIINLDALTYAGNPDNLSDMLGDDRHVFIKGNICDTSLIKTIFIDHDIDTIVNFAAETHVDRSIHDPATFIETNIQGTYTLLEAAKEHWGKASATNRFHHISTDEVYGTLEPDAPAFSETTAYAPNSPYAATKAASDHLVRAYTETYSLPCTISNCSNNYGPYQFPEKLIPLIILNATSGKPLPVYGDGGQIRDWLYVEDHCEAIYKVLCSGRVGETYTIGGGNQVTNLKIIKKICQLLDTLCSDSPWVPHSQLITFVQDRAGHDRRYAIDASKIEGELDWRPKHSLSQGLEATITWYLSNEQWIAEIDKKDNYREWIAQNYKGRELQ